MWSSFRFWIKEADADGRSLVRDNAAVLVEANQAFAPMASLIFEAFSTPRQLHGLYLRLYSNLLPNSQNNKRWVVLILVNGARFQ